MSDLRLFLLGPPRVEVDGEPVHLSRRKMVALLVYLAVTGRSHSRDYLATLLWPEYDQSSALAYLRRILSMLNKALGEGWLAVDRETAGLYPDADLWLDVDAFRQRLAACETHNHPAGETCPDCLPLLEEAVALYGADFMAGFTLRDSPAFDEFQFFQTEGLRGELASALERLVGYHSAQGVYEQAIPYARRWLALDPLHEPAHRRLMRLYAQAGHRSAAMRQYRTCLRVLEEELNLPPSAETTALYERIRAERARPAAAEPAAPVPAPTRTPLPAFLTAGAPPAVERPVFVVRERELARLNGYLDAALAGQGQVAFVTGGPGRGKTALMGEFARRAMEAHPGLLVAGGTCNAYSGVGDPYLPFREVLGMLTGDVEARWAAGTITREHARRLWSGMPRAAQALVDHGPFLIGTVVPGTALLSRATAVVPRDTSWLQELRAFSERKAVTSGLEQRAMFEQVTNVLRALAAQSPLLLTLDNLQWADAASIGLLFHLGWRLEGSRILVACAYRPEEVAIGRDGARHPLESVLGEFKRRFGDVWIDLRQADEQQGRRFVDAFLDTEPNRLGKAFREALSQRTGGHPLFTVELLRAMQERGDVVQDADGCWVETPTLDWERVPARVEAVIEARVGRLEEELRDMLAVASVEGEQFTAQVMAQVQGIPERDALRALSQELGTRHRLVREGEEMQVAGRFLSHYQFAHALFQAHLHNGLSSGERRLLHGEVAGALELLYGDRSEDIAVQLAHHYAKAGHRGKTVEYSSCAGNQAELAYANEEAIAHFNRALDHLDPSLGSSIENRETAWRLEALRGLGRTYHGMGRLAAAERCLREAIALGQEIALAPRELVRIYHYLSETLWWQEQRFDDIHHIGEEGLALLGNDADSVEAILMEDLTIMGSGRLDEFAHQRAQVVQRLPYSPELRPVCSHIFYSKLFGDKNLEDATKWLQILGEKAASHHDLRALAVVHAHTGEALKATGDLHGSIPQTQRALELLTRVGDAKLVAFNVAGIMETFLSLGDLQKAEEYADRALEAMKTVGTKRFIAEAHCHVGRAALCQGNWEKAVDSFEQALQLLEETDLRSLKLWVFCTLGRAYQAQGKRGEALNRFEEALALARPEELEGDFGAASWWIWLHLNPFAANTLSGLEAVCEDSKAFQAFCDRYRSQAGNGPFVQWYLEPADVGAIRTGPVPFVPGPKGQGRPVQGEPPLHGDEFAVSLAANWDWQDPFGDCSFALQDGLEIHAANGRDLRRINLSAPRLLRAVSRDWAAQTVCVPVSGGKPVIGGLLIWRDRENYLRLDGGTMGEHDILFSGSLGNQDVLIGRGRLESASRRMGGISGRVFLRLERVGERVNAFCSADGAKWFTVGHVAFPVEDPLQVGLHAIGNIDRMVYHGAYPDGTAIRFESFRLWEM
jgi:DNA-binding SARP family transcriptional activator